MSKRIKEKTRRLQKDLEEIISMTESMELEKFMTSRLKLIEDAIESEESGPLSLQVVHYGFEEDKKILVDYINDADNKEILKDNVKIKVQDWKSVNIEQEVNDNLALIIFISQAGENIRGLFDHLAIIASGIPLVKVYSFINWKANAPIKKKIAAQCGRIEIISLATIEGQTLQDDIESMKSARNVSLLKSVTTIFQFKNTQRLFKDKAEQLNFSIISKKQQLQQQLTKLQQGELNNYGEIQEIRRRVQNRIKQFEKQFKDYQKTNFNPPVGNFYKQEMPKINQLNYLEDKKTGKQIIYVIPEDVQNDILTSIKDTVTKSLNIEKEKTLAFATSIEEEVSRFLGEKELKLLTKTSAFIDSNTVTHLVNNSVVIDRKFEERVSDRSGIYNFFMNARRYYMVIFMLMPMLGIGLSAIIDGLGYFMIPISVLILGIGGYSEWSNQQKEKEENKEKNLDKARTYLTDQIKRILGNLSKGWKEEIIDNLKEQTDRILSFSEQDLQNQHKINKSENDKEKNRLQAIFNQLKTQESAFGKIDRSISRLNDDFNNLKVDINEKLESLSETNKRNNESRHRSRNY